MRRNSAARSMAAVLSARPIRDDRSGKAMGRVTEAGTRSAKTMGRQVGQAFGFCTWTTR
jgi:hypothetical protein